MGHCLDLNEEPQNLEQILSDCKETLKYCVKTGKIITPLGEPPSPPKKLGDSHMIAADS